MELNQDKTTLTLKLPTGVTKEIQRKKNQVENTLKAKQESSEKIPELEKENFKIDSTNWETKETTSEDKKFTFKVNPEEDILELAEGFPENLKGEQLFNRSSSLRETEKNGRDMISDSDFEKLLKKDGTRFAEKNNIKSVGYYRGCFTKVNREFFIWTKEGNSIYGSAYVGPFFTDVIGSNDPDHLIHELNKRYGSVRCIKK